MIAKDVPGELYIVIDGKLFPATLDIERKDVAEHFNIPAYRYSGFERFISVSDVGTGKHKVSLKILTIDKTACYKSEQELEFEIYENL